jgi:hypothetical protein
MTAEQQREYVQHLRALRTSPQTFNKALTLDTKPAKVSKSTKPKINEDLLAGDYGF